MRTISSRGAALLCSIILMTQCLQGCFSMAAYRVGKRTCAAQGSPETTDLGSDGRTLYITYDCNLTKPDFSGLSSNPAGVSAAFARIRFDDLFRSGYGSVPVFYSTGRPWLRFYKPLPNDPEISPGKKACYYVTGSSPNSVIHSTCGSRQDTTPLRVVYQDMRKGFTYREWWGYPLLPIALPLGVAADIVASPFYIFAIIKLQHTSMSDRDTESRTRAAHLIAYDW